MLNTPRYTTALMPSALRKAEKSRSVRRNIKNPQAAATTNCKKTITFASIRTAKMPVVTIWQANSRAQPRVSRSPIWKEMPLERFTDKMPMPIRHKKEERIYLVPGFFLLTAHHKNGTITTLAAVMKALLEGVVYCSATVCT